MVDHNYFQLYGTTYLLVNFALAGQLGESVPGRV